jgi:uncharacterized membrane protein YgcG
MNKKELWLKLRAYHFDHLVPTHLWEHIAANFGGPNAFSKAFASKIARKHNWNTNFALRAVKEYKKFVYLGIVGDFIVTPSKIIDVVWHEHLLFSKGYREFCTEVIAYEFDHYPELIALDEQTGHFNAQYKDTLELYRTEFGINPPDDIWEVTKFDREKVSVNGYQSRKKRSNEYSSDGGGYSSDTPLCNYFDGSIANESTENGGGDFGGGGAGGDWTDADSGSSDSGSDGGSDSGGDGGSSCSSGCGGCGGGD